MQREATACRVGRLIKILDRDFSRPICKLTRLYVTLHTNHKNSISLSINHLIFDFTAYEVVVGELSTVRIEVDFLA